MTAIGAKVGMLKREANQYVEEWNAQAPVLAKSFRAQADIDRIYVNALEQIKAVERSARS